MSPGFTSRPFVERPDRVHRPGQTKAVSPGFTSRPSLSAPDRAGGDHPRRASVAGIHVPAFVERASSCARPASLSGVAGIHVPAFVERCTPAGVPWASRTCVAGIHVPAFVERAVHGMPRPRGRRVSPGFTSRPSLSDAAAPRASVAGIHVPAFVERRAVRPLPAWLRCVAGIHVPAFVERGGWAAKVGALTSKCRRDSRPGLR